MFSIEVDFSRARIIGTPANKDGGWQSYTMRPTAANFAALRFENTWTRDGAVEFSQPTSRSS